MSQPKPDHYLMFTRLKQLFTSQHPTVPVPFDAPVAPDGVFYAIGDLHGRVDLMDQLLEVIDADAEQSPDITPHLIFVGDYIDRGEDSAQTLERLIRLQASLPEQVVCLLGNHEKMMLDFLESPVERGRRWLRNGGLQTLASYGVGNISNEASEDQLLSAHTALKSALPEGTEAWLRKLPLTWQSGNIICVHAALDPAKPLHDQSPTTCIWGHRDFLKTPRADQIWVLHGHTTVKTPQKNAGRIEIDTGAYFSNNLSAAKITANEIAFLSVG